MLKYLKSILPLFLFVGACFVTRSLNAQQDARSFDRERIKEYRSKKDYDYFKRAYALEPQENSRNSRSVSYATPVTPGIGGAGWRIIIALAVVLILVVILLIAKNADGRGNTRNEVLKANTEEIEAELDEEEIDRNDFDSLINKAKSKGNFRLAIRLLFLKSLQGLDEKKIIKYKKNKTNYDYVFEIKNMELQTLFKTTSDHFSWVWYGNQDIDTTIFSEIEPSFHALTKKIGA